MEKTITLKIEDIANLHNSLCALHPTGDDIITVAQCILTLRKAVESENSNEQQDV